jgi:hypothetical protein
MSEAHLSDLALRAAELQEHLHSPFNFDGFSAGRTRRGMQGRPDRRLTDNVGLPAHAGAGCHVGNCTQKFQLAIAEIMCAH